MLDHWNVIQQGPSVPEMISKSAGAGPVDVPTVILLAGVYVAFGLTTTLLSAWSLSIGMPATALVIAQFSSVQHEVLHGHPFASRRLNEALVLPGLTLFVPFARFRDLHLAHHHDEILTDPYDDPESNYLDPEVWAGLSRPWQGVLRLNNTLCGRILLGPMVSMIGFVSADLRAIRLGDRAARDGWLWHVVGVTMVLVWLWATDGMPVWAFVLAAYLGFGLLKIRTFLEHRAHDRASGRTVIVEDRGPLAFLFLNNNLHVVHHMHPKVAWYRLPGLYRQNRERYLARNGGYVYTSYAEIFRRYFLHAKDSVPHPLWPRK